MDPVDRFTTPRPPPIPSSRREFRIASASSVLPKRSTRSVSPGPSWTGTARRILGFKLRDRDSERGRKSNLGEPEDVLVEVNDPFVESRSVTPSGSIRSRELSPESLRKFLSDDLPATSANIEAAPGFSIPDDIEEETEENDDDDNFADTAVTESNSFTNLSPPPSRRGGLSAPPASHARNTSPQSLVPPVFNAEANLPGTRRLKLRPAKLDIPRSHSTLSVASSSMASAASPNSNISQGLSQVSFFDDSDDEDLASCAGDQTLLGNAQRGNKQDQETSGLKAPITSYSLPPASTDNKNLDANNVLQSLESPASNLYRLPDVDLGLDDLVGDVDWINDVVPQKAL